MITINTVSILRHVDFPSSDFAPPHVLRDHRYSSYVYSVSIRHNVVLHLLRNAFLAITSIPSYLYRSK